MGVTFLSKICTVDGHSLVVGINDENEDNLLYKNLLARLIQLKPNTRSWALWNLHLQTYTMTNSLDLKVPLGDWTCNHSKSGKWTAYRNCHTVFQWMDEEACW